VAVAIEKHIPMEPLSDNLYLGATQAYLSLKWAAAVVHFAGKHRAALLATDGAENSLLT
jgi:hypothetical protein